MLSENNQTPKDKCRSGFTYLVHLKSHICGDRKQNGMPVVEVMGKQGVIVQGHGVSGLQDRRSETQKFRDLIHNKINMLNTTELHSQNQLQQNAIFF